MSNPNGKEPITASSVVVPLIGHEGVIARTIGKRIFSTHLTISDPGASVLSEWSLSYCSTDAGSVDMVSAQSFGSAPEMSWVEQPVLEWAIGLGFADAVRTSRTAAMICQGASFHTDGVEFSEYAFCIVWLSDDAGLELSLPGLGVRMPLQFGTTVLFDPAQPHGVVLSGEAGWDEKDYLRRIQSPTQHFVSFDIHVMANGIAEMLDIQFKRAKDVILDDRYVKLRLQCDGRPVDVDPVNGAWNLIGLR